MIFLLSQARPRFRSIWVSSVADGKCLAWWMHSLRGCAWVPSLFNQPNGHSLGARLNWAFLNQLRSAAVQKSCWYMLYSKILKTSVRYILSDSFELKNGSALTFKSHIFEVFVDKHGQVSGDSVSADFDRGRPSSGGSRLLMKTLLKQQLGRCNILARDN